MQAIEARASAEQVTLGILGTQLSTWDLLRIASGQVRERPAGMAGLVLLKAARSWYGTDSQRLEGVILLLQLVFLTPAFAALAICLRGPPERRQLALVTVALVLLLLGHVDSGPEHRSLYGAGVRAAGGDAAGALPDQSDAGA